MSLAIRTSAIASELNSWESAAYATEADRRQALIGISEKVDALQSSLEALMAASAVKMPGLASLASDVTSLRTRVGLHLSPSISTAAAAHSFACGSIGAATEGGESSRALPPGGRALRRTYTSLSLKLDHLAESRNRSGRSASMTTLSSMGKPPNCLGKRAPTTRKPYIMTAASESRPSLDFDASGGTPDDDRMDAGDESDDDLMADAAFSVRAGAPPLALSVAEPFSALLRNPDDAERNVRARATSIEPTAGRVPPCGIVHEGTLASFSRPEAFSFVPEAVTAKLCADIAAKGEPQKKDLKAALYAIMVDYPEIGSFHLLPMTAQAIKMITGIDTTCHWNQECLDAVCASLADTPLEYPPIACPSLEAQESLYEQMKLLVYKATPPAIEQLKGNLRAIITAAPALMPSYMNMLITQAYYKTLPGERITPILWPMKELPILHAQRMYHFLSRASSQKIVMDMLKERLALLTPAQQLLLKRALSPCTTTESSFLSPEQKLALARAILHKATGASDEALSGENILDIDREVLKDLPVLTGLPEVSLESLNALKPAVVDIASSCTVETLREIITDFKQIMDLSSAFDRDTIIELANQAFTLRGLPQPHWTDEDPTLLITRIILLITTPWHM